MKKKIFFAVAIIFFSAVPRVINYQGKLVDSSGVGVNGTIPITFRLYTISAGGSPIWEETQEINVRNGLFSAFLGNLTPFPDSVDFSTEYWLELVVNGEIMSPRERLTSAPYSIRAASAETGYNPIWSEANSTRRTGGFVFRAGPGATLADDGSAINITLSSPYIPSLDLVLGMGNSAGGRAVRDLGAPVEATDAATKAYVDSRTENPDWLSLINRDRGAGQGLSFAGDSFSVNVDNSSIEIVGDVLRVKANGITSSHIATGSVGPDEIAETGVTPGSYTAANITVDADGRITAASNGVAGIGGSGTPNYIPKFTSANTIGNSVIYEDAGKIGIGTTSVGSHTLKVGGTFNGVNGVFIDNLVVNTQSNWNTTSSSFVDLPNSSKTISIPSGTAIIFWSMSCYSGSGSGDYRIRPVIGSSAPSDGVSAYTNEGSSHKTYSGSWITNTTGGTITVKLQVRVEGGGALSTDINDQVSWTLIVFRD